MPIKRRVEMLVQELGTCDPIRIAAALGIIIEYCHLKGIWGYFQYVYRIPVVHVAVGLSEALTLFIVVHELGHRILHPGVNVPFLRANTYTSIGGYEREANQFAVELRVPDELLLEVMSIYEAAAICGVPEEVAELKMLPKSKFWRNNRSYFSL